MNDQTQTLLDYLRNPSGGAPTSATTWMQLQTAEREHYENQTRDILEWRSLDSIEQAQQRLSNTPLAQRVSKINTEELAQFWAGEPDSNPLEDSAHAHKEI